MLHFMDYQQYRITQYCSMDRIASKTFASQFLPSKQSQLSLLDRLILAVRNNRCDLIWSLAKSQDDLNTKDSANKNLLFYAAYEKCEVALLYLLRAGTKYKQELDSEHKNLFHFICYSGGVECLRTLIFFIKLEKLRKVNEQLLKMLEMYGFKRTDMKDGLLKFEVSNKRQAMFAQLQQQATKMYSNYLEQYKNQMFHYLSQIDQTYQRNPLHLGCLNKYQKCLPTLQLLFKQLMNPNIQITNKLLQDYNTTNAYLQQKIDPRFYQTTLKNLSQIPKPEHILQTNKKYETTTKSHINQLLQKKDKQNQSALYIVSKNGSTSMINFIQKYTMAPQSQYKQIIMKVADNNLARSHIIDLCDASQLADVKSLNFLISCGEEVNNKKSIFGTFALIQALKSYRENSSLEPIMTLIRSGADVNIQDTNGWTVLHHASSLGLKQVIELLIKNMQETKLEVNKLTNKRYHAIHLAAMHEHPQVISIFVNNQQIKGKVNIDVPDWDGCTALIHAAKKGSLKVLKALLDFKANIYAKDVRDMTALHHAAFSNHSHCIRELLNYDADFDKLRQMRSTKGKLAKDLCTDSKPFQNIFTAARTGNVNLIRKLSSENASLKDSVTLQFQRTPLILAVLAKSLASVKFLVDTGADTYHEDKNGKSAAVYCQQMIDEVKKSKSRFMAKDKQKQKDEELKVLEQIKKIL